MLSSSFWNLTWAGHKMTSNPLMKTFISTVWCGDSQTYNLGSGILEIWSSSYHNSSKWLPSCPDHIEKTSREMEQYLSNGTYSETSIRVPVGYLSLPYSNASLGHSNPRCSKKLHYIFCHRSNSRHEIFWDLQHWPKCKAEPQEGFWPLVSVNTPVLDFSIRDVHHCPA